MKPLHSSYSFAHGYICAIYLILFGILLQNAETRFCRKNLILIGTVFSGLTVILPNMGNRTGGECS